MVTISDLKGDRGGGAGIPGQTHSLSVKSVSQAASMYQPIGIHAKEPLSEGRAVLLIAVLSCMIYGGAYGVYVLCV